MAAHRRDAGPDHPLARGSRAFLAIAPALLLPLCALPACGALAAQDPEPSGDARLRGYKEDHYRAMGPAVAPALLRDLVEDLRRTGVLLLGDHHEDREIHARELRLVEDLRAQGFALAWLLECVGEEDGEALLQFARHDVDLDGLRSSLGGRGTWLDAEGPFDGAFYRALLAGARHHSEPFRALEPFVRPELEVRDPLMVASILRARGEWRKRTLVVVVGHAHLLGKGHVRDLLPGPATVVLPRLSREAAASARGQAKPDDRSADAAGRDDRWVRLSSGAFAFLPSSGTDGGS